MRNPAFIALLTVLSAHPEVVFYSVDWRSWVHFTQPREYPHREDSAVLTAPTQTRGMADGRHSPYPLGGSGDMERYASSLSRLLSGATSAAVDRAPGTFAWLSEAVLADLRDDYADVVEWQRRPDPWHRLHRRPAGHARRPVARRHPGADRMGPRSCSPSSTASMTRPARGLAEETASYRPQTVALSLF
jgi:hypothetical protein